MSLKKLLRNTNIILAVIVLLSFSATATLVLFYAQVEATTNVGNTIDIDSSEFTFGDRSLNDGELHVLHFNGNNNLDVSLPVLLRFEVLRNNDPLVDEEGLFMALKDGFSAAPLPDKTYLHPSDVGTSEQDCFDDANSTCLTRDLSGPVFNAGTDGDEGVSWGCGACGDVGTWYDSLNNDFKNGCVDGNMPNIIGTELCLETQNNGKWDIEFNIYQSGGGGGFGYTRSQYALGDTTIHLDNGIFESEMSIDPGDFSMEFHIIADYAIADGQYKFRVTLVPR